MSIRTMLSFLAVLALTSAAASERQHHGVAFEDWVRKTFFDGYTPENYTQKWDIPAAANTRHGGIPVNPKVTRYRSSLDLGDALRQFDIAEPFLLVIGFWQEEGGVRRMVNITVVRVTPKTWRKLWGPITRGDLEKLDAVIKDRSLPAEESRRLAQEMKSRPPFTEAAITLNPKIDWKTQRRLQCSLSFEEVFRLLAPGADAGSQAVPSLWGVPFPGVVK